METKKVIIFGNKDLAELAHFYLENDPKYKLKYTIHSFTMEKEFIPVDRKFKQYTIWDWKEILKLDPKEFLLFAPIANNKLREKIYNEGKGKGFTFISYVSSKCTCFSSKIGENCFILEDNTLQPFTEIGNNCVLWSGNHIGHHSIIEDNCFFTSHVVVSGHCNIGKGSFLGVNSTLRDGITIGENCVIGMGSLVTKSTKPNKTYFGSPAREQIYK